MARTYRLNQYLAQCLGIGRRKADDLIAAGEVQVDGAVAHLGLRVDGSERIVCQSVPIEPPQENLTVMLHKPIGYVCSRNGQGAPTIYELLPAELQKLKPVGRLDKESTGLLLLTNNGELSQQLGHPSQGKIKRYKVRLNRALAPADRQHLERGVSIDDSNRPSKLVLLNPNEAHTTWQVQLEEGRNRQIRRSFAVLGYTVTHLKRTHFGSYVLGELAEGAYIKL